MNNDDLLGEIVNICHIGAQPGGAQILEALYPGTQEAVRKATKATATCPVCRSPHPSDVACKPLEASDNGYTLTRREDI